MQVTHLNFLGRVMLINKHMLIISQGGFLRISDQIELESNLVFISIEEILLVNKAILLEKVAFSQGLTDFENRARVSMV